MIPQIVIITKHEDFDDNKKRKVKIVAAVGEAENAKTYSIGFILDKEKVKKTTLPKIYCKIEIQQFLNKIVDKIVDELEIDFLDEEISK